MFCDTANDDVEFSKISVVVYQLTPKSCLSTLKIIHVSWKIKFIKSKLIYVQNANDCVFAKGHISFKSHKLQIKLTEAGTVARFRMNRLIYCTNDLRFTWPGLNNNLRRYW